MIVRHKPEDMKTLLIVFNLILFDGKFYFNYSFHLEKEKCIYMYKSR